MTDTVVPGDLESARVEGYRELFDNSPIGIINVALDGRPLLVNERAAATFGYDSPEEFLANVRSLPDLWVYPEERDRAAEIMLATGVLRDFEVMMRRRDGRHVKLSVSANPWRDRDGNVIGLQVSGIDITDRIRAEQRLEEAQANASIAFWTWDLARNELVHTRNLFDVFGIERRPGPLSSDELRSLVHADDREMFAMKTSTIDRTPGSVVELEFRVASDATGPRWLVVRGRVDDDGTQLSGFVQDITEQRLIREKLTELNDMKTEFVGVVAHDLSMPLTVAAGYADFLLGQWDEISDDARREFVERMKRSLDRLGSLVAEVSELTRLESGALTFDVAPFDLGDVVRAAVEDVSSVDPRPSIRTSIPGVLPYAVGNRENAARVLTNLLSNAVKYAPGTPIDVDVDLRGDLLQVSVCDRGPGIAPADRTKLFHKFSRLPSDETDARPPGTGLGLFICRTLVEANDGTIWVEPTPGGGSTFCFTVPVARERTGG